MNEEYAAAAFVADLTADDIPEEVQDHAQLVLADTIAAIVGGSTNPDVTCLVTETCTAIPGNATIVGHDVRTSRHLAALANGTAGTVLELDEGHKYAAGHPAIHVLPALLAEAEVTGGTGADLLTAFVAGYEVVARVARACYPLRDGYHPHGVWGSVGAAIGIAHYRGYDAKQTVQAMQIAANQAQHTLMAAATEGATVRQTFAGMANCTGLLSADLAATGFTGVDDGVARHLRLATADSIDNETFNDSLGERWEITRGYFKRHAACRYTHPALDVVKRLQEREIKNEDIAHVDVETYPTAATLSETHPTNALQAKFSVPFAVATRLLRGESGKSSFVDGAIDSQTLALAERVTVTATDEMAERLPDKRSARVTIEFTDGRTISEEVVHAKGGTERPYTTAEVAEKFEALVAPVLGDECVDRLWGVCTDEVATAKDLLAVTRPS